MGQMRQIEASPTDLVPASSKVGHYPMPTEIKNAKSRPLLPGPDTPNDTPLTCSDDNADKSKCRIDGGNRPNPPRRDPISQVTVKPLNNTASGFRIINILLNMLHCN